MEHTKQAGRITKNTDCSSDGLWRKRNKIWTMHSLRVKPQEADAAAVCKNGTWVRQIFNIIHVISARYFEMLPNTFPHVKLTVKNQNSFKFQTATKGLSETPLFD